jgi:DNA-binding CsgD family transcriptional regulator
MRVLLAGSAAGRERLRALLAAAAGDVEVAGEFASAEEAAASPLTADAIVVAPDGPVNRPDGRVGDAAVGGDLDAAVDDRVDDRDVDGVVAEALTAREVQVLELLAEGLPNKRIADRLHISDQTVKFHVASIMGKLGAGNRVETVRRAVRRGLISL